MAEEEKKVHVGTVDVTPTWAEILPSILAIITDSPNMRAVQEMRQELHRMAVLADERNAMVEQGFPPAGMRALDELGAKVLSLGLEVAAGKLAVEDEESPFATALLALSRMVEG